MSTRDFLMWLLVFRLRFRKQLEIQTIFSDFIDTSFLQDDVDLKRDECGHGSTPKDEMGMRRDEAEYVSTPTSIDADLERD